MKLGIPTLCRYDLLVRLIESAERGSVRPTEYLIVDNGGSFVPPPGVDNIRVVVPGKNIGVAAAWNLMLDDAGTEPIVISNDDVVFSEHTFRDMVHGTTMGPFVSGDGWCLFAQTTECTTRVGYYDENFWPAYYEDSDYSVRLQRARISRVLPLTQPFIHEGWATTAALGNTDVHQALREQNRQYFLSKWGGIIPGNDPVHLFPEPFNGAPPTDWRLRSPERRATPMMRWDVLNYIAKKIGATRYLEIGVSNGDCMRRVEVAEKWGVDPEPHPDGVKASTVFVGKTSDEFFKLSGFGVTTDTVGRSSVKFDLIFIDSFHEAEHAFREVTMALACLRSGGVVVMHDCNPSTEAMQDVSKPYGEWTGDVWRTVARIRSLGTMGALRVVADDYGIGVLIPGRPAEPIVLDKPWDELGWGDLERDRERLLGLLRREEWEGWFDGQSPGWAAP